MYKTYRRRSGKYGVAKVRSRRGGIRALARPKTTAVTKLARAVRTLQKKVTGQHQYQQYFSGESQLNVSSNLTVLNLCNWNGMNPVFGADGDDDNDQKIQHVSFGLDLYFSLENAVNNEEDTVNFTVFLVSLKDNIGGAFSPVTGALTLTDGQHYAYQRGLAMVNKKLFNIHNIRRFTLSNHGTALAQPSAQTQFGTDYRYYLKHRCNDTIMNPIGDWKALSSSVDPSKQYYLLIFNDNSTLDLESPCVTYSKVHTMKTLV